METKKKKNETQLLCFFLGVVPLRVFLFIEPQGLICQSLSGPLFGQMALCCCCVFDLKQLKEDEKEMRRLKKKEGIAKPTHWRNRSRVFLLLFSSETRFPL